MKYKDAAINFRKRITKAQIGVRENGKMHDEAAQWHHLKDNDNSIHSLYNKRQFIDDSGDIVHEFEHKNGLGKIDNSQGSKWMARHTKGQPTYHDTLFDAMKQMHYENPKLASINFRKRIEIRAKSKEYPDYKMTPTYNNVFFAQGDEANEYIDMIENNGPDALLDYLESAGALDPDTVETSDKPHRVSGDHYKEYKDGWIVSWNYGVPYVGVEFKTKSKKSMNDENLNIPIPQTIETIPTPPRQKIPYEVWIKSKKSDGITYEQWKRRVDKLISKQFGMGMDDFPDWRSMDAYEGNKTVEQGFRAFKRSQGSELFASINYRKNITARLKIASTASEDEKFIEDKEVVLDGILYDVSATISYVSEYEPETGDGWNEPREDGYYSVSIDLKNLRASGEDGEITNPQLLERIKQAFMIQYSDSIEEDISNELMKSAEADAEPYDSDIDPYF